MSVIPLHQTRYNCSLEMTSMSHYACEQDKKAMLSTTSTSVLNFSTAKITLMLSQAPSRYTTRSENLIQNLIMSIMLLGLQQPLKSPVKSLPTPESFFLLRKAESSGANLQKSCCLISASVTTAQIAWQLRCVLTKQSAQDGHFLRDREREAQHWSSSDFL